MDIKHPILFFNTNEKYSRFTARVAKFSLRKGKGHFGPWRNIYDRCGAND